MTDDKLILEGGKGGGRAAVLLDDTGRSTTYIKGVTLLSEGEIEGISGGDLGILINDTPLGQGDPDQRSFADVYWDIRYGTPSQTYMEGFGDGVGTIVPMGVDVAQATPAVRAHAADVDAAAITLIWANGIGQQDSATGDTLRAAVDFAFDARPAGGTWAQVAPASLNDKLGAGYSKQFLVPKPTTTGAWETRVRRVSADDAADNIRTAFKVMDITEVRNIKPTYDGVAVFGFSISAEQFNGQIPTFKIIVKGIKVQVPVNFDPVARTYAGLWNGTFKMAWTNDPAWVLYAVLTNETYGMGLPAADIDVGTFYAASVYNNQLVSNGKGGLEPRFTFDWAFTSRDEALRLVNSVAGAMNSYISWHNGVYKLIQDRPSDSVRLITAANTHDEAGFDYFSSKAEDRHSAFSITWQDPLNGFMPAVLVLDEQTAPTLAPNYASALTAATQRYGYERSEVVAFGCIREGQALRQALWALDTELNLTECVRFKMGEEALLLNISDVVDIDDTNKTMTVNSGRFVSVNGTAVVLDRAVTLVPGSKLRAVLADGLTYEERSIVQTSGTTAMLTLTAPFSQAVPAQGVFAVATSYPIRKFRIESIVQETDGETLAFNITARQYDPNKWSRVEQGINLPAVEFASPQVMQTNAVSGITARLVEVNDLDSGLNGIRRSLTWTWTPPTVGKATKYALTVRSPNDNERSLVVDVPTVTLHDVVPGQHEITVVALSVFGMASPATSATYTINLAGGGASTLAAPTNLQLSAGGTTFSSVDAEVEWVYPASNNATVGTLREFEVRVFETAGNTLVRVERVPPVKAGEKQFFLYSLAMNIADGGPRRSIRVEVRCIDARNNLSSAATATFTNPAPAAPTLNITSGAKGTFIDVSRSTDIDWRGVIVWGSKTSGFTLSESTVIATGAQDTFFHGGLNDNETWFYKVAAFDTFTEPLDATDYAGTGLNISSQVSATTAAGAVTQEFILEGSIFKPNDPSTNSVSWTAGTMTQTLGGTSTQAISAGSATWTSGALFIYWTPGSSTLSTSTSLATAVGTNNRVLAVYRGGTALQAENGRAFMDGGLLLAQSVGATVIQAGAVNTQHLAAQAITASKMAITSQGRAVNLDPMFTDPGAWRNANDGTVLDSDIGFFNDAAGDSIGKTYIGSSSGTNNYIQTPKFVIDPTKTYKLAARVRTTSAANNRTMYVYLRLWDANGNELNGATNGGGQDWGGSFAGYVYSGLPSTSWQRVGDQFGAGTNRPVHSSAKTASIGIIFQYGGSGSSQVWQHVQDLRLEEVIDGTLIVNGTIQGRHVLTNSLTSDKIDTRGLLVKDSAGNVILGAGNALNSAYAAAGTLNSAVTLNANGTLSGAGGGQVTISGLGYTGNLNATSDIVLLPHGTYITIQGNTITRSVGGNWGGGAYSQIGYDCAFASCRIGNTSAFMFGLDSNPTQSSGYDTIDYAIYWASGDLQIYENGSLKASGIRSASVGDELAVVHDGQAIRYYHNGVAFYERGSARHGNLYFDSSISGSGGEIRNVRFGPISRKTGPVGPDPGAWNVDRVITDQPGYAYLNGTSAGGYNGIELQELPNGHTGPVWLAASGSGASNSPEGGWNSNAFPIDPARAYMFSCWVKAVQAGSGNIYWGLNGMQPNGSSAATVVGSNGASVQYPYFVVVNRSQLIPGRWYLCIGYVYPWGQSAVSDAGAGVFDGLTGALAVVGYNYKWNSTHTMAQTRAYQYYTSQSNQYTQFWNPRVDIVGAQDTPTRDQLLAGATVNGRNRITPANVGTYIESLNTTLLDVSIRNGAQRLGGGIQITNNRIRVYDSTDIARLTIGEQ